MLINNEKGWTTYTPNQHEKLQKHYAEQKKLEKKF